MSQDTIAARVMTRIRAVTHEPPPIAHTAYSWCARGITVVTLDGVVTYTPLKDDADAYADSVNDNEHHTYVMRRNEVDCSPRFPDVLNYPVFPRDARVTKTDNTLSVRQCTIHATYIKVEDVYVLSAVTYTDPIHTYYRTSLKVQERTEALLLEKMERMSNNDLLMLAVENKVENATVTMYGIDSCAEHPRASVYTGSGRKAKYGKNLFYCRQCLQWMVLK